MSEVDWIQDPEAWNTVRLGDHTLPGIAEVTMGKKRKVDFKYADGKDGGTSTDKGSEPARLKIRLTMNARQWREEWVPLLPYLEPSEGKPRGPFGIVHPEPNSRKIEAVEILAINADPPKAKSGYRADLDVQQWFPRPKDTKAKKVKYADLPISKLFTNEGTDNIFNEPLLRPAGPEALELAFGPQTRQGVTVVEDPVTGKVRGEDGDFYIP